ncbi:MAG: Bug family tripartite tricarboxylate transporter substrate binding protein [Burkholderiales bacterium]
MWVSHIGLTVVAALTLCTTQALAQTYPAKPVRMVVPFPAGGTPDILGRILAQKLTATVGQPVLIDNRGGAAGNIGVESVARSAPDGYTLVIGNSGTFAVNPSLYAKLPFNPTKDFTPVTPIAMVPNLLVVHPSLPVKSVKELVAIAKARPGEINYGSAGVGSVPYMAVEYFKQLTDTNIVAIQYRGVGAMLTDLLGGQISMTFAGVTAFVAHVKAKQLRALAVGTKKRIDLLPDVPTVAEAGIPKYEQTVWYGVLAPAGTPRDVVAKLNAEIVKALQQPDMLTQFAAQGATPTTSTPEEFGAFIRQETARWAGVIKASGAKPE